MNQIYIEQSYKYEVQKLLYCTKNTKISMQTPLYYAKKSIQKQI